MRVVSEADRSSVTGFGGISQDRVETGFIGMDTKRFRPGLASNAQREEFGITPGTPIVTHIKRFDTGKEGKAKQNANLLLSLYRNINQPFGPVPAASQMANDIPFEDVNKIGRFRGVSDRVGNRSD